MVQIKKQIANIWEYTVGNNANIANFVCLCNNKPGVCCGSSLQGHFLCVFTALDIASELIIVFLYHWSQDLKIRYDVILILTRFHIIFFQQIGILKVK